MLTRREFLAAGTAAAALVTTPSGALAQTPRKRMRDAVPPTSPSPVSARPSDNLGGTTVNVGSNPGDLQTAISAAINADGTHKGNTYVVPTGVVYAPVTFPVTTGSGWTCIRSASGTLPARGIRVSPANAGSMFLVRSSGVVNTARAMVFPDNSNGWRIIGCEATHPNGAVEYAVIDLKKCSRILIERCYMHPHVTQTFMPRVVIVYGTDVQVWDSWFVGRAIGQDAQAIAFRRSVRTHVENCELQGTGENILIGDQDAGAVATDLTFKRNHLFKDLIWRHFLKDGSVNPQWDGINWVIKNLFEVKWGRRILVEGNIMENNWGAQGQPGPSLLFAGPGGTDFNTDTTADIMVRSNKFINLDAWCNPATYQGIPPPLARVAVLNNLVLQCGAQFLGVGYQCEDLWVEHNTCVPMDGVVTPGVSQWALDFIGPINDWPRNTIRRNVFGYGKYGLRLESASGGILTTAAADQHIPDRDWRENAVIYGALARPPAVDGFIMMGDYTRVGVNPATGVLAPNSPLKAGGGISTDGTDLGVDFVALNAAQTGTQTEAHG